MVMEQVLSGSNVCMVTIEIDLFVPNNHTYMSCGWGAIALSSGWVVRKLLQWAMKKKGIPEVLVRSVVSLFEGAKTSVRVGYELSVGFAVKVRVHHGNVFSFIRCRRCCQ